MTVRPTEPYRGQGYQRAPQSQQWQREYTQESHNPQHFRGSGFAGERDERSAHGYRDQGMLHHSQPTKMAFAEDYRSSPPYRSPSPLHDTMDYRHPGSAARKHFVQSPRSLSPLGSSSIAETSYSLDSDYVRNRNYRSNHLSGHRSYDELDRERKSPKLIRRRVSKSRDRSRDGISDRDQDRDWYDNRSKSQDRTARYRDASPDFLNKNYHLPESPSYPQK